MLNFFVLYNFIEFWYRIFDGNMFIIFFGFIVGKKNVLYFLCGFFVGDNYNLMCIM